MLKSMRIDYCIIDRKNIHGLVLESKIFSINKKIKIKRLNELDDDVDCKVIYFVYDYLDFIIMNLNHIICGHVLIVVVNEEIIKQNKLGPNIQLYTPDSIVSYLKFKLRSRIYKR